MSNGQKVPWATLSVIAVCIAVAFSEALSPGLTKSLALVPGQLTPLSFIGSPFAHENILHLLANMIFLAAVGPLVEFSRGAWRFLLLYFVGGLAGTLGHLAIAAAAGSGTPLLGASGAVAACVGYCAVRFMRTKVPILPNIGVPVGAIALVWVVVQIAGGLLKVGELGGGDMSGSAFWAHIAGFLAGLAMSVVLGGLKEARQSYGHEVLERMNLRGPAAVLAAAEEHLKLHPGDKKALRERAEALEEMHEPEAMSAYRDLLAVASSEEKPEIIAVLAKGRGFDRMPVVERLRLADSLAEPISKISVLKSITEGAPDVRTPDALLSLALAARDSQPDLFKRALDRLTTEFPMHDATGIARQKGLIS
ncbi:MAG: rhomboid family intramembrane serine protease [Armatimonadetes bacterium]|nr:rhomboid family intramembrane serine protease [Armatimonadota bacterium]